jgi:hypothetical protein
MKKTITVLFAVVVLVICNFTFNIDNSSAQWQPEVRLTNDPASSNPGFNSSRSIAANGNVIHAVWYDNRDGNNEIYYKRSTDAGLSWGVDTRLTNDTALSIHPSISVSGSFVHVTWTDKRDGTHIVYYKRSTDGGVSWGADTRLRDVLTPTSYAYPSISSSGSNLHVVWFDRRDAGDAEIYYKNSTDDGNTWSADKRLTNSIGDSYIPVVAVSGSNVHVAWYDNHDGNNEIYYKRSADNGTSWGADTRLTNNSGESRYPSIAVSGSTVHIAWSDNKGTSNYRICYRRSTNGGTSWSAEVLMTNKNNFNIYSCLAVNGSVVNIAYVNLNNHGSSYDIIFNKSINDGATWGTEVQLTNNASASLYPSIVVSGTTLHVLFMDDRDGNSEIYYKQFKSTAFSPNGITNNNPELPKVYSLSQNYPNPFNPTTNIKFSLPNNSFAKLVIYDATGKELESLVSEQLNAGTYEVVWSANRYSSGVYYYKLTAGDFSKTNKMILLK